MKRPEACTHPGVFPLNPDSPELTCRECGRVYRQSGGDWLWTDSEEGEALRTRPGDQVLPDGDESLEDDQTLLIRDIEERRQVGIQRYRQGHRPFNGRNTVRDWYEEQLDGLVYARSILRMHDADRDTLVAEVSKALEKAEDEHPHWFETADHTDMAEVAVDRIMGWVTAQRLDGMGE
jgi:hypothetical protein